MKKLIVFIMVLFIITISTSQNSYATEFDSRQITDEYKPWRIVFSNSIDKKTVTGDTVYIENITDGVRMEYFLIYTNNKTIRINNVEKYEEGKNYNLVITEGVKSVDGQSIKENVSLKFTYTKKLIVAP